MQGKITPATWEIKSVRPYTSVYEMCHSIGHLPSSWEGGGFIGVCSGTISGWNIGLDTEQSKRDDRNNKLNRLKAIKNFTELIDNIKQKRK